MKLAQVIAVLSLLGAATAAYADVGPQGDQGKVECPYMKNSDWTKSAKDSLRRTASTESSKQPSSNSGTTGQTEQGS